MILRRNTQTFRKGFMCFFFSKFAKTYLMNSCLSRQIPEEVTDKSSPAWNKGRAWIDGAEEDVVQAYARRSEEDLDDFLRCRKEEIVEGGVLFILMGGRPSSQRPRDQLGDPDSRDKHPFTTSMDRAWQDLLDEVCPLRLAYRWIRTVPHSTYTSSSRCCA